MSTVAVGGLPAGAVRNHERIEDERNEKDSLPPLENGDRLIRQESHRRYEAMPHLKKAELIEGTVVVPSLTRWSHGEAHGTVALVLGTYAIAASGVQLLDNATVFLDADNEVQPDVLLRIEQSGTSQLTEDGYVEGPPEFIFEIAGSSVAYDLHDNRTVYRRSGVGEYVVWALYENELYWYRNEEGVYVPVQPDQDGMIRSRVLPGLQLPALALLNGQMDTVLAGGEEGLKSPEHAEWVRQHQDAEEGDQDSVGEKVS